MMTEKKINLRIPVSELFRDKIHQAAHLEMISPTEFLRAAIAQAVNHVLSSKMVVERGDGHDGAE